MGASIVFRCDASLAIGSGHVMRCLTLAERLRSRGMVCRFVCREHRGHLLELIAQQGFEAHGLPPPDGPSEDWLGVDWRVDAARTAEVLSALPVPAWIVADHYGIDCRWEEAMRRPTSRLMVIDDLANRAHDCDLLLDQNHGREPADYEGLVPGACKVLAGTSYALLRPDFALLRPASLARRDPPALERILVALGGVDLPNATGAALSQLASQPLGPRTCLTVVMGPHAPALDAVRRQATAMPWPTTVLVGIDDMARRMAESDFAIGAAGTSAWERCCLGLPSLALVLADNQRFIGAALAATGAAYVAEDGDPGHRAGELVAHLQAEPERLLAMGRSASRLVDGLGVPRVVECLIERTPT